VRETVPSTALPAPQGLREKLGFNSSHGVVWVIACGLLVACAQVILKSHSLKYPAALMVAAAGVSLFMVVRHKYVVAIFAAGFTLPFYVQYILVERDKQALGVSGTFLVMLTLLAAAYGSGAFRGGRFHACPSIVGPLLLFLFACLASMVNTPDRTLSLIALERETEMLLVFLILINVLTEAANLLHFLSGLYLGFAVECVIYVIQNILGYSFDILGNTRFEGTTDVEAGRIGFQRGTFAASQHAPAEYFCVLTLFLVGVYLSRRRLPFRMNPMVGMLMGGGCLLLAAKRAPLAGFAMGLAVLCILVAVYSRGSLRRLAPLVAVLAVPALALLPLLWLRTHQNNEGALEERMNLTHIAWQMYSAHPALGVGVGTYDSVKREFLPDDWKGWLYTVHSRYMLFLAETGILGLGTMLFMYVMVLWQAFRGIARIDEDYRPIQIALVGIFVAFYWEMFWHMFDSKQQNSLFWFMVALSIALPRVFPSQHISERRLSS
jgi:O-antigen ligase